MNSPLTQLILGFILIASIQALSQESQQGLYNDLIQNTVKETLQLRQKSLNWIFKTESKHFKLFSTEIEGKKLQLKKIEGIIPASFEKVAKYYFEAFDNSQYARNSECGSQILIESLNEDSQITFYKGESNAFFSSREHLSIQHKTVLSEDEILITRTTITEHQIVQNDASAIRIDGIFNIFLKKINENQTRFESFYSFDFGGYIPYAFINFAAEKRIDVLENDIKYINQI